MISTARPRLRIWLGRQEFESLHPLHPPITFPSDLRYLLKLRIESVFLPEIASNISSNKTSNTFTLMPDFLTRRNGTWHFARRVPTEFAHLDRRGVVKHSTKIRIASDRGAVRASRVAEKFNSSLEQHWRVLADSDSKEGVDSYNEARRRARQLGFDYIENAQLVAGPAAERLERLETLVAKDLVNDEGAREAVLGLKKKPVFKISKIFEEYEAETKDQVLDLSPDQLRIWRNARKRVVKSFVGVISDKFITELTIDDAIDFRNFWRDRVVQEGIAAKSANREIGQLSGMIKELNILRRLGLPDLFRGLRLKGEVDKEPTPYENKFIQNRLLADGALDGLNEDARYIIYVIADSGLRPSEIVNLNRKTIHLSAKIPYVSVLPDGRNAAAGSAKNITPNREKAASNEAGSNGNTSASAWTNRTRSHPWAARCANASTAADRSIPTTVPSGATARTRSSAVSPPPQPMSRTLSPGCGASAAKAPRPSVASCSSKGSRTSAHAPTRTSSWGSAGRGLI